MTLIIPAVWCVWAWAQASEAPRTRLVYNCGLPKKARELMRSSLQNVVCVSVLRSTLDREHAQQLCMGHGDSPQCTRTSHICSHKNRLRNATGSRINNVFLQHTVYPWKLNPCYTIAQYIMGMITSVSEYSTLPPLNLALYCHSCGPHFIITQTNGWQSIVGMSTKIILTKSHKN